MCTLIGTEGSNPSLSATCPAEGLNTWEAWCSKGSEADMSPHTVTPDPQKDMPRQQGLLLRGSRWYSNFKVPLDLRAAFGKQHVRESLETSDYREAVRKIAYERARWSATFEHERQKLTAAMPKAAPAEKRLLTVVSKQEAFELATRYLASREAEFRNWMDNEGRDDPDKREAALENVGWDKGFSDWTSTACGALTAG